MMSDNLKDKMCSCPLLLLYGPCMFCLKGRFWQVDYRKLMQENQRKVLDQEKNPFGLIELEPLLAQSIASFPDSSLKDVVKKALTL